MGNCAGKSKVNFDVEARKADYAAEPENNKIHKSQSFRRSKKVADSSPNLPRADSASFGKRGRLSGNWSTNRLLRSTSISITACGSNDFVPVAKDDALDHAALRLRKIIDVIDHGRTLPRNTLRNNLHYCAHVMEATYIKINRPTPYPSNEELLSDSLSSAAAVPHQLKSWIEETFSNKNTEHRRTSKEYKKRKHHLRSIVRMVQASIVFDKMFQKFPEELLQQSFSPVILKELKKIDRWTFNIFSLNDISEEQSLLCVLYELFAKHDFIRRFKIPIKVLKDYSTKLLDSYEKHKNQYHNQMHAADVAQTVHCLMNESGFMLWMSDVEVFATILAAIVHDLEHTGTTNAFHINTKSSLALLYNDKSILEQHHISTAFRLMHEGNCDIMRNFSKQDYKDCRTLMIEMVLSTDMSYHFDNLKQMEGLLTRPHCIEKAKAMCLLIHAADLNHPAKPWKLHYPWTERVLSEFFKQGDREKELGLPVSPLCDRDSAMVAQSQMGFIDYVVTPTFTILFKMFNEAIQLREDKPDENLDNNVHKTVLKQNFGDLLLNKPAFGDIELGKRRLHDLKETVFGCLSFNREEWGNKDKIERELNLIGDKALQYHQELNQRNPIPESEVESSYLSP